MNNLHLKFQRHIDNGLYQGIEWKIIHQGEISHDKVGYSDLNSKTPLLSNSLYRIWSMTKPIISVVILQLIQENKIKLEDPIKKYLPVFENLKVLKENSVHYDEIGLVTEKDVIIDKEPIIHIDDLVKSNTNWLKEYMDK